MRRERARLSVVGVAAVGVCTAFAAPAAADDESEAQVKAKLVRTTNTARFHPPSPDPAGITHLANRGRLLLSDSEVEEMSSYQGVNLFYTTRTGKKTWGRTTEKFSAEPSGVAYRPSNHHLFVADDQADEIYEIAPGDDGGYATEDDTITSFSTREAGNKDPEDVTFDSDKGDLLVIDGTETRIYRYDPGEDGRFDGSDDEVTEIDVGDSGAEDPEGIAYYDARNSILVLDHKTQRIYELSGSGDLLTTIDISAADPVVPAGLTVAPASDGSKNQHLYIVDRGIDNDNAPDENDGRMYEMSVDLPSRD